MSKYKDIQSYKLAVKLRTPKTILVEGTSDKTVISRFLLGRAYTDGNLEPYLIDDASMISNEGNLSGIGNRDKVLLIAKEMSSDNHKINCLVDREWDGVDFKNLSNSILDQKSDHALFTKGHSIENYWFDSSALTNFLLQSHPTELSYSYLEQLENRFINILRFAASYSIAAKESSTINKLSDILESTDIEWNGNEYTAKDNLNKKLMARNSQVDIASLTNKQSEASKDIPLETLKWICHGHLGEEAIRVCSANLAAEYGASISTISAIERGNKQVKLQHDASHITNYDLKQLEPLGNLLSWVST